MKSTQKLFLIRFIDVEDNPVFRTVHADDIEGAVNWFQHAHPNAPFKVLDVAEAFENDNTPAQIAEPYATYRNNIVKMLDQQRAKGLAKYGETLEQNDTLTYTQRIEHAQEEALDLLQYLEHLKQCYTDHMTVADYERAALRTVNPENVDKFDGHGLIFEAVTGLNEEAGECSGIIKKHVFQGHELDRDHLAEELGDVAWYLVLCCKAAGLKFEDVLQMNNTKRAERYPDGFDKARSIDRRKK